MSKVISSSRQAARLEDRGGGGEERRQMVMGEQNRLYTGPRSTRLGVEAALLPDVPPKRKLFSQPRYFEAGADAGAAAGLRSM